MRFLKCCDEDRAPWITECGIIYTLESEARRHMRGCWVCKFGQDDPAKLYNVDINRQRSK